LFYFLQGKRTAPKYKNGDTPEVVFEFLSEIVDEISQLLMNGYVGTTPTASDVQKDLAKRSLIYFMGRESVRKAQAAQLYSAKKSSFIEFMGSTHSMYALALCKEFSKFNAFYSDRHAFEAIFNRFLFLTDGHGKALSPDEFLEEQVRALKRSLTSSQISVSFIQKKCNMKQVHERNDKDISEYFDLSKGSNKHTYGEHFQDVLKAATYFDDNSLIGGTFHPGTSRSIYTKTFMSGYRVGQTKIRDTTYIVDNIEKFTITWYPDGENIQTQSLYSTSNTAAVLNTDISDLVSPSSADGASNISGSHNSQDNSQGSCSSAATAAGDNKSIDCQSGQSSKGNISSNSTSDHSGDSTTDLINSQDKQLRDENDDDLESEDVGTIVELKSMEDFLIHGGMI
jgi:hypothetical protein